MTKLIQVNLSSKVPRPIASPQMTDFLFKVRLNCEQPQLHQWQPVDVKLDDDRESLPGLTDMMFTVPFVIVSRRFADLLTSFACECEYLPLVAYYKDQVLQGDFFALNVLRVVREAIDTEKSVIEFYDQEFKLAEDVQKLILKENTIPDVPLVYLREISKIAVSDKLAQAIADADLVGVQLLKPEEFTSY